MNLFDYADRFPNSPGYRNESTSKEAARDIAPKQGTLQARVLDFLKTNGPAISREIAYGTGIAYGSIQPRTSELKTKGVIEDSGQRRPDPETGKRAIVWRAR